MSDSCECCVFSGTGLCDVLITRPEISYRGVCVFVFCVRCDTNPLHLSSVGRQKSDYKRMKECTIKISDLTSQETLSPF